MKKNLYLTILTVVTILCIIGGSFYHMTGSRSSSESVTLDSFRSIEVDGAVMDLTVTTGNTYSIEYSASEKLVPEYKVTDGILTLKQSAAGFSLFGNEKCRITITVPASLDSVDISSDVGDITLEQLTIDTLSLKADVGDIDLDSCSIGTSILAADVGDIELDDTAFDSLSVTADVGDVSIDASSDLSGYTMNLSTDIGTIEVRGLEYKKIYEQTASNDHIITIKVSTGDIEVDD